MSRFTVKNLPLYSFHLNFGFRGGKIEKERTRSFSIHEDFDVFSVKKTQHKSTRETLYSFISASINQFAQRILHFIVKFYFKFSSLFSPQFFLREIQVQTISNIFLFYPHYISILPPPPPSPKKQHKRSHPDFFVPFINKQDVSLSRYGDKSNRF